MFGEDQRDRLLRESWTADDLAQELYAMFDSAVPANTLSTVSITPPPGSTVAPITIGNIANDPNAPILTIKGKSGETLGTLPLSAITNPGSGGGGGGTSTLITKFLPSMFPGQVLSGGPGMGPYQVNIYPNGILLPPSTVSVTQLSLSGFDTVPVGTWTFVIQVGPQNAPLYYMQVPVWLS